MQEYVFVGKIVGTHGIKGEIKLISDYSIKDKILISNQKLYIGKEKKEVILVSCRKHKNYDLLLFREYNNINEVLSFKNKGLYLKKEDLPQDEIILEELVSYSISLDGNEKGKVIEVIKNKSNILLKVEDEKSYYIPMCDEYITKIDSENKKIEVKNIEGLMI